jgi:hypothetical protein
MDTTQQEEKPSDSVPAESTWSKVNYCKDHVLTHELESCELYPLT